MIGIGDRCIVIEAPHLVDAEDVVRVRVREEDRVHAADVVRQRLRAQIGGRVDEDVADRAGDGAGIAPTRRRHQSRCRIDGRVRRSRGSVDRHTAQSQPMAGTPLDVPVPSIVTRNGRGARRAAHGWMMRDVSPLASRKRTRSS